MLLTYNEQGNIARTLQQVSAISNCWSELTEIRVVDNCSTDLTAAIVRQWIETDSRIGLILQSSNVGYRENLATALRCARGQRIFVVDGDGQFDPTALLGLDLCLARGADLVLGYRVGIAGPTWRRLLSFIFRSAARLLVRFDLTDINSGMRALSRQFAKTQPARFGYSMANPELFMRARANGLLIAEFPVAHSNRLAGSSIWDLRTPFTLWKNSIGYLMKIRRRMKDGLA